MIIIAPRDWRRYEDVSRLQKLRFLRCDKLGKIAGGFGSGEVIGAANMLLVCKTLVSICSQSIGIRIY